MNNQTQNLTKVNYTDKYGQKNNIQYENKNLYIQNNPKTYYAYNQNQPHQVNNKNSNQNQLNKQISENQIITETYYIDQRGHKIILNQEKRPKTTNQLSQSLNLSKPNMPQNQQIYIESKKNQNTPYHPYQPPNNYVTNSIIDNLMGSTIDNGIEKKKSSETTNIFLPRENNQTPNNEIELDPKKSATLMSVISLASIPYNQYPNAEYSKEPFFNISGYGYNSYNGKVKKFNEDRIKVMVNYQLKKYVPNKPNISYFSIFDGHSGNKCSDYLRDHLDGYLFNSQFFPKNTLNAIKESFKQAEANFRGMVYDPKSNILLDKSGSCALVMLILNDVLYSINLGDSRALYSYDTGKYIYQITRDHKPNDPVEKERIEKAGGKVFYANTITRNGREIELKEEQFGKGFSFPYRISPGKIAVSSFYNNLGCKNYWRLLCKRAFPWRVCWWANC